MITCSAWILSVTEYQAKIWEAYLRWQEQKMHSKVASVDFRNKKDFGWHDHVETLCFENGKSTSSRVFKELSMGIPCCGRVAMNVPISL